MTTHVFIVDDNTFKYHLEYMFAGTGAGEKVIDFNNRAITELYSGRKYQGENTLVAMMADGCRIRKNDLIIFYVQASKKHEGLFFGIFQAVENGVFLDNYDNKQFLYTELKKSLTFRIRIKAYEVYPKGVTEWTALDEIKNICSPCQMLWSLIYRKLRANRGNTMITIYESERLLNLIRIENNYSKIDSLNLSLTYDLNSNRIITSNDKYSYYGRTEKLNILPRLITKYNENKAHEVHLQMYVVQNLGLGINESLDNSFEIKDKKIEWLGNEVSCGVGMQRIDVMFSVNEPEKNCRILFPIELKAVAACEDNTRQLNRYIDWLEQYYIPNIQSIIQPVLLCKKVVPISSELKKRFCEFNKRRGILPLKYIEYEIVDGNIVFSIVDYKE